MMMNALARNVDCYNSGMFVMELTKSSLIGFQAFFSEKNHVSYCKEPVDRVILDSGGGKALLLFCKIDTVPNFFKCLLMYEILQLSALVREASFCRG